MTIQAIIQHSQTTTITFSGKPNEVTRAKMHEAGFIYKGMSRWVRTFNQSDMQPEENVVGAITA